MTEKRRLKSKMIKKKTQEKSTWKKYLLRWNFIINALIASIVIVIAILPEAGFGAALIIAGGLWGFKYWIRSLRKKIKKKTSLVIDYCSKYLSSKDDRFKQDVCFIMLLVEDFLKTQKYNKGLIYSHEFINEEVIDLFKEYIIRRFEQGDSKNYDNLMEDEISNDNLLQLIEDVKKIKKILNKKEIEVGYVQVFKKMNQIAEQESKKRIKKSAEWMYKLICERLPEKVVVNKELIIKEYLKMSIEKDWYSDLDEEAIFLARKIPLPYIFDKFGFEYSDIEIELLVETWIEEIELEDFENNLGKEYQKKIGDFSKLNGHQFEDYLKELFSILGYQAVRTKLSGDQGADLIVKIDGVKTVIQAKKYQGSVTNKAVQEVVASKKHYGADNAMVVTTGTFTKSAIELAKSNKVDLWDKDKLKKVICNINKNIK
jgi:hypothetical protein